MPEPNVVNGIVQNFDEIISRITERCQAAYPLATNPDMTAKDNAVNQFVAYHLLPMRLTWDKLVIHYIENGLRLQHPVEAFNKLLPLLRDHRPVPPPA